LLIWLIKKKTKKNKKKRANSHAQQSSLIQQRIGKKAITAYQVKMHCFPTNQKTKKKTIIPIWTSKSRYGKHE
jgi:hypothetical protein